MFKVRDIDQISSHDKFMNGQQDTNGNCYIYLNERKTNVQDRF